MQSVIHRADISLCNKIHKRSKIHRINVKLLRKLTGINRNALCAPMKHPLIVELLHYSRIRLAAYVKRDHTV